MRVQAFAKINLSLRVLDVRSDGYHELQSVFQSIALHDTLAIRRRRGLFRLTCDDPRLPVDRRNLVWRAADAMWDAAGRRGAPRDVAIHLTKRIPIEAGLGGGSSDAAAALRALARVWRVDAVRVRAVATALGADVPYFLEGGTALGLDRGNLLFRLADQPPAWVVVVVPPFGVSTREAYGWLDKDRKGERGRTGSAKKGSHAFFNDLQAPVARRHPEIGRLVSALRRAGASHAAMSGSGSAVFGLFESCPAARSARSALAVAHPTATSWLTRTLSHAQCRRLAAK